MIGQVKMTIAVGLAVIAGVAMVTLGKSPPRVLNASAAADPNTRLSLTTSKLAACQSGETVPAGASAMRLSLLGAYGARVHLTAYEGSKIVAEGSRAADWTGSTVTVPVSPIRRTAANVKLCFDVGPNSEPIYVMGLQTPSQQAATTSEGQRLGGRLIVQYLAAGQSSWWSRAKGIARRMGLGHVFSGSWLALLAAALVAATGVVAVRLALKELP